MPQGNRFGVDMAHPAAVKAKIIIIAILVLVFTKMLVTGLTMISFKDRYIESLVASNGITIKYYQHHIENDLKFGKPIDKLYGLDKKMAEAKADNSDMSDIYLYRPDGHILFSFDRQDIGKVSAPPLQVDFTPYLWIGRNPLQVVYYNGDYHILTPIMSPSGDWAGTLDFTFRNSSLNLKATQALTLDQVFGLLIMIAGAVLMFFIVPVMVDVIPNQPIRKNNLYTAVVLVIAIALGLYLATTSYRFKENFIKSTQGRIQDLGELIQNDIQYLLNKNVQLDRLKNLDLYLARFTMTTPEISTISILDTKDNIVYGANTSGVVSPGSALRKIMEPDNRNEVILPLTRTDSQDRSELMGELRATLSLDVLGQGVWDIYLYAIAFFLIGLGFAGELFAFLLVKVEAGQSEKSISSKNTRLFNTLLGRLSSFIYLLLVLIPTVLIPSPMGRLYEPITSLYTAQIWALPFAVEIAAALIAAGFMALREDRGWAAPPLLLLLVIIAAGHFLAVNSATSWDFILFRGLAGLGYGFCWSAITEKIFSLSLPTIKRRSFLKRMYGLVTTHLFGLSAGFMIATWTSGSFLLLILVSLSVVPVTFLLHLAMTGRTERHLPGSGPIHAKQTH